MDKEKIDKIVGLIAERGRVLEYEKFAYKCQTTENRTLFWQPLWYNTREGQLPRPPRKAVMTHMTLHYRDCESEDKCASVDISAEDWHNLMDCIHEWAEEKLRDIDRQLESL